MTTTSATTGQLTKTAAEIYDAFFVPALFGEWAGRLCDAAEISPGVHVLDVACGTGATTREAADRVGPHGRVVGLDLNKDMLNVARSRAPTITWTEASAETMPFAANSFDTVLCQFGLMFFEDRTKALQECARVLRPGGRIAISVWDRATQSPGYAGMIELIDELFGSDAANALRAPFVLGNQAAFQQVLSDGGLATAEVTTLSGTARFASIREWVRMDVRGWTLAEYIDDAQFETLVHEAEHRMAGFVSDDGWVRFPAPAHIAVWTDAREG